MPGWPRTGGVQNNFAIFAFLLLTIFAIFAIIVSTHGDDAMDRHPYEEFLEQVPVDGKTVLREAILFARSERKLEVRVLGRRKASLYDLAKVGMQRAMDRETCRRNNIAGRLWRESLDPVTREINGIELQITLLRDKRLGKLGYARQYIDEQIDGYTARLAELKQPFAQAAE